MNVESVGPANGLDVGSEENRKVKDDSYNFGLSNQVVPFSVTGRGTKVGRGGGTRILFGLCETERPLDISVEKSYK